MRTNGAIGAAWTLRPDIHFLNHGSFGATPRAVLERQQELRTRIEAEPVRALARELQGDLDRAKQALADFLGADVADIGPVPNATTGVNAVLRSLRFAPGDELLVTSHGYNACSNAMRFVAERWGAEVVVADLPFPVRSEDDMVEAVLAAVTDRTRLALFDHVTSPTAVVLPVERLARELKSRGVSVLVDGAHAPGMLPLDLQALGAAGVDYYTGNCHKWMCAPKGAAFLWVRRELQADVHPVVISHGRNAASSERSRFQLEFDWVGTDDPTAFLCVPDAIETVGQLAPGGWDEVRERNRALALEARRTVADALGVELPVPDACIGSIASLPLPDRAAEGSVDAFTVDDDQRRLYEEHAVEIPIFYWPAPPRRLIRLSAQLYNDPSDYAALATGLTTILAAPSPSVD